MKSDFRSIYVAFDPHPTYKGASTHIDQVVKVLADVHPPLLLLTLGSNLEPFQSEAIHHLRFESEESNILRKAISFRNWVANILSGQFNLMVGHYRDCWSGMAFQEFPHVHTVFEVNGFPSIELPYRFQAMAKETLEKIEHLENSCLQQSSIITTPSHTTKRCIEKRGVPTDKIVVIPNGADIPAPLERDSDLPDRYVVYMGALQPWQGVDVLIKSMRYLEDVDISLLICSSYTVHYSKPYRKYAEKLGVSNKISWRYQLEKTQLQKVLQHALVSVAPLTECSRNIEQGCSPLKILESMACGTPVIASQLPAVEEIIKHNENGFLCRPGRPADLARAIRIAADFPDHTAQVGQSALRTVQNQFTWRHAHQSLYTLYHSVLTHSY